MIQKQEDPPKSASQQETSQLGKEKTYPLLHSIPTIFTARFKNKKRKSIRVSIGARSNSLRQNQTLTFCSIPFPQYSPHDSKRKGRISIQISIAARSESIRQIEYLQPAPFHSHNIFRAIQKQKEEDPFASASQQETSQSGKSNTYTLLHSIRTTITA